MEVCFLLCQYIPSEALVSYIRVTTSRCPRGKEYADSGPVNNLKQIGRHFKKKKMQKLTPSRGLFLSTYTAKKPKQTGTHAVSFNPSVIELTS